MPSLDAELRTLTASFASDLVLVVKRAALEEVARVIKEVEAESPPQQPNRKVVRQKPTREPSAPLGSGPGGILEYVRRHPGERSENVRAAVGLTRGQMQNAVKKLLASGKLKAEGERRATRYFVR
jgi:hypothetical protein